MTCKVLMLPNYGVDISITDAYGAQLEKLLNDGYKIDTASSGDVGGAHRTLLVKEEITVPVSPPFNLADL